VESNGAAPANVYAFSKVIMDNIATRAAAESPDWIIVACVLQRYDRAKHTRVCLQHGVSPLAANESRSAAANFQHGEQKRDFVYVKDVVEGSIRALDAQDSGIYNLGSGQARSFNELVDVLNNALGQIFSRTTSIIRTHIIKTLLKPISRTRTAPLDMSRGFPWKRACGITCSGCIRQERRLLSFLAQSRMERLGGIRDIDGRSEVERTGVSESKSPE